MINALERELQTAGSLRILSNEVRIKHYTAISKCPPCPSSALKTILDKKDENPPEDVFPIHYSSDTEAIKLIMVPESQAYHEMKEENVYFTIPSAKEHDMSTSFKFIPAQTNDTVCKQLEKTLGEPGTQFDIDDNGILVQKVVIDGGLQIVVSIALQRRQLFNSHNCVFAGHPGCRHIYSKMQRLYYCPHMAIDLGSLAEA